LREADRVSGAAWAWFAVAVALGVAEITTLTLAFAMVAVACALAGVAAAAGAGIAVQVPVAVGTGLAGLLVVRPVVRRHLTSTGDTPPTGIRALIGAPAIVVSSVTGHSGQVRVGGELWAARLAASADDEEHPLVAGTRVWVASVDGATVTVYPSELT
jgi:membrane protein implicated in regulation of membrane protease activity